MARPFAYNSGSQLSGTAKYGNLTVATSSQNFSGGYGGVKWFNGPDESIGWVLGFAREDNQEPGFIRTDNKTDAEFLSMVNNLPERRSQSAFTDGASAKTWLNTNGYWTSWTSSGPLLLADLNASDPASYGGSGSTWIDLTSNNNDGTLSSGSGSLTFGTIFGGEFDLNAGSGTRIEFANNSYTQLSTSSTKAYSIWFKADAVGFMSFSRTLMCKLQGLGGSSTSDGFWMAINSSNQLIAKVVSDNGATTRNIAGIGATINTGTWYMATLVTKVSTDSDTFKLYINTTEVGSTTGGGTSLSSDNRNLILGNYDSGVQNAQPFDGMIGNFYVYEGDFDATQVQSLFDRTKLRFGY